MSQTLKLISQQRARFALEMINNLADRDETFKKQCLTVANSIPAQIQRTGLGQTLAFACSKKSKNDGQGWVYFYEWLNKWLCTHRKLYSDKDLLKALTEGDMRSYQQAQAEALSLLIWVRKFARALLKEIPDKA